MAVAMKQTVGRCMASGRSENQQRNLRKWEEDIEKLVTPAELKQLGSSEQSLSAIKLLESFFFRHSAHIDSK